MSELPSTENMLADLAKVEGLGFLFQALAMFMDACPRVLTEGEAAIVRAATKPEQASE